MKKTICAIAMLLCTACGFQSNPANLPAEQFYVSSESAGNFMPHFQRYARLYHLQFQSDPNRARYQIHITQDGFQTVSSIASPTLQVQYQRMIYTVRYDILSTDKKPHPPQVLEISRELRLNNNQMLGNEDEIKRVQREIERQAVEQFLFRLHRLVEHA